MLITLAAVVFFAAIIIFFSQEIGRTIKKILAIKGALLLVPLALASYLVFVFDYLIVWVVHYYREILNTIIQFLTQIAPAYTVSHIIIRIILITLISVFPVLGLNMYYIRKTHKPYPHPYTTSFLIWIISVFSLMIGQPL